jgi:hypothetical protein
MTAIKARDMQSDDLRRFSKHVLFEARQLLETACLVRDGLEQALPRHRGAAKDAWLATFTVSLRGLLDFLNDPPADPRDDDVFAKNYNPGWHLGTLPAILIDAKGRVGKEIGHLTTERLERENNKEWPFLAQAQAVKQVFEAFLATVPTLLDPAEMALYRDAARLFDNPQSSSTSFTPQWTAGTNASGSITSANTPSLPPSSRATAKSG